MRRLQISALWAIVMWIVGNAAPAAAAGAAAGQCNGQFPNPITDICWSCTFPWSIAGAPLQLQPGAEDSLNVGGGPTCVCNNTVPPKIGLKVAFWEPARLAEFVRTPYCFLSLQGAQLEVGVPAPRGTNKGPESGGTGGSSFYHGHWYMNPVIYWVETAMDNECLEDGVLDVAYMTEIDPLWADSISSFILNPEVVLFSNPIAAIACAADCAAASAGFGTDALFWCGGCQGSMYPLVGHVGSHVGGVQASALLTQRLTAKLHREMLMWVGSGEEGLCGLYPNIVMRKTNYKHQMLYPVPWTQAIDNRCCAPFGRTSVIWGSGKEFPYGGEDFSYQIFRKRDCCSGMGFY